MPLKRILRQARKALRLSGNTRYRAALRKGVAAAVEHAKVLKRIEAKTALDVGANKGQFSLVLSYLQPNIRIYAFEPLAPAADKFESVFAGEGGRVHLFRAAIGPQRSTSDIYVSKRDDSSSLLPITSKQEAIFPGTGLKETTRVDVGRLSDFVGPDELARPVLLKIDVQGYELEVLKGCDDLLSRIDHIIVECSFVELYQGQAFAHEVTNYLWTQGYTLAGVYNVSYDADGYPVQADFIFRMRP